jgi:hypothetical protein
MKITKGEPKAFRFCQGIRNTGSDYRTVLAGSVAKAQIDDTDYSNFKDEDEGNLAVFR